jgi:hypothetical protein
MATAEIATRLGVTVGCVSYWTKRLKSGEIAPDGKRTSLAKKPGRRPGWSPKKVKRAVAPEPTTIEPFNQREALMVFKMLKRKCSLEDIVIECNIHPKTLRLIIREYEELTGAFVIYGTTAAKINELSLDGTFPIKDGEGLYDVMCIASEDRKCRRCQKMIQSRICPGCERKRILKNLTVHDVPADKPIPVIDEDDEAHSRHNSDHMIGTSDLESLFAHGKA